MLEMDRDIASPSRSCRGVPAIAAIYLLSALMGTFRNELGLSTHGRAVKGAGEGGCICGDVNSGRLGEEWSEAGCPFILQHKRDLPLLWPRLCVVHSAEISIFISLVLVQFSFHFGD